MNKTGWIIFVAGVVLLLGGLVTWTRITNPPLDVSSIDEKSILAASTQSGNIADQVRGKADSAIVFMEYGDFQCPSCAQSSPNMSTLYEEYGSEVAFVFRNFPLTTIHPNARAAAAVAEAAGLQGKFWEMHDLLYENQSNWSGLDSTKRTEVFNGYAASVNVNIDTFKIDAASSEVAQKISFDQALGKKKGVSATPSFYLNGEQLEDATSGGIVQGDLTAIRAKFDELISANK